MRYTPDYTIEFQAEGKLEKVSLLFCSWTFHTFCKKIGIEMGELYMRIASGELFKPDNYPPMLLAAAEAFHKMNGFKSPHNPEIDPFVWIDEIGGYLSPTCAHIYKIFVARLTNKSVEELDVEIQKKQEEQPKKKEELTLQD